MSKRNVYKGHRYVPKIMGEWNQEETYEGLSIVTNQGTSFTSKKRVPVGIDILDEEYWVVTGNYNAQVENYRQEVKDYKQETTEQFEQFAVHPVKFGAVGDGVTDDTQAFQDAIEYCETNNYTLHSTPDYEYLTTGNEINKEISLTGTINLKAKEDNQEFVLKTNIKINSNCDLNINGEYKSLYGLIGQSFGRSNFNRTVIERCKIWGMEYRPTGNNNFVIHDYFMGRLNGYREDITLTKVSNTSNVNSSTGGYGTYSFESDLAPIYKYIERSHFIIYEGEAYKINKITDNQIEIINFSPVENGETVVITFVSGGALNIPKYGDNGVGSFNGLDVISNRGVGVHNSSLYSHNFNNFVAQGNAIGFSCNDFTYGLSLPAPYFEANRIDFVAWGAVRGTITRGIFDYSKFQGLINRRTGNLYGINELEFISSRKGHLTSLTRPVVNPSMPVTVTPGFVSNYERGVAGDWVIELDNETSFNSYKTYITIVNISNSNEISKNNLIIQLKHDNGDTIQGQQIYEHPHAITGKTTVILFKVGSKWVVNVLSEQVYTNVNYAPVFMGQIANSGGKVYIATGTENSSDWKEIQFVE